MEFNITSKYGFKVRNIVLILLFILGNSFNIAPRLLLNLKYLVGLYIVFYLVGDSIFDIFGSFIQFPQSLTYRVTFKILASVSYVTIISLILSYSNNLSYRPILFGILFVYFISLYIKIYFGFSDGYKIHINYSYLYAIIIILYGISLAQIFMTNYPFPSIPGRDIYTHLGNINWIITNNGSNNIISFRTSIIPYSYVFHLLISTISIFLNMDSFLIFWTAPFFLIPFSGVLVYSLSYLFTTNRIQSFFSAMLSMSLFGGGFFLGPEFMYPSTISMILYLVILIFILSRKTCDKKDLYIIYIFAFFNYLVYFYSILVTFPLILIISLTKYFAESQYNDKLKEKAFYLITLSMFLLTVVVSEGIFDTYETTLIQKIELINSTYPDVFIYIYLIGYIVILSKFYNDELSVEFRYAFFYKTMLMLIILFPPVELGRIEIFIRFFVSIISTFSFINIYSESINFASNKLIISKKYVASFFVIIISIIFVINPYLVNSKNMSNYSTLSHDEYELSQWIANNTKHSDYILTDPSTGKILRGFAKINCSDSFIINGQSLTRDHAFKQTLFKLMREDDSSKAESLLESFPYSPKYHVITTRTSGWLNGGVIDKSFSAPPNEFLNPFPGCQKYNTSYYNLVKSWDSIRVYEHKEVKMDLLWEESNFNNTWEWWLGGDVGAYSSSFDSEYAMKVQSLSDENGFYAIRSEINLEYSDLIIIRYKISPECYALRIRFWDENRNDLHTIYLNQSAEWVVGSYVLPRYTLTSAREIVIQIWTRDSFAHELFLDKITIYSLTSVT